VSNRLNLVSAVALAGLFGFAPVASAQTEACGPAKITKKLEKPMNAALKAREAKDWAGMLTHIGEAAAVPVEKTEYDKFWINELTGIAHTNLKQYPQGLPALDAAMNSPAWWTWTSPPGASCSCSWPTR